MYAELHCKTNFSFLEGASHADELIVRAAELGYAALAVTDRDLYIAIGEQTIEGRVTRVATT